MPNNLPKEIKRDPAWFGYTEYDALLAGEKLEIERSIFERVPDGNLRLSTRSYRKAYSPRDDLVLRDILRYAFEKKKGWEPEEAYELATYQDLADLKLLRLIRYAHAVPYEANVFGNGEKYYDGKRVRWDQGLDPQYVVGLAYPELYPYSPREEILKSYKMILSGEMKKIPWGYFSEKGLYEKRYGDEDISTTPKDRAVVCLEYSWILEGIDHKNKSEVEAYMESRDGRSHIRKYKLFYASKLYGPSWRHPGEERDRKTAEQRKAEVAAYVEDTLRRAPLIK